MNIFANLQQEYLKAQRFRKRTIQAVRFFILICFLAVWEITADLDIIDSFFFSSPSRIIRTILQMANDYSLFHNIGITLLETVFSFVLIVLISLASAMLLWLLPSFSEVLDPYLVMLNSLPKSALAPLFIVWLGANTTTIIVAGISVALFGSILNLYQSFKSTDEEMEKLIYTLGGTKWDVLSKAILPSNIPTILSSMKVNIGLSLVGVIIGEFLAARAGLGYLIIYGSQVFKLDLVIMSFVFLCFIALVLYGIIVLLEKHINRAA